MNTGTTRRWSLTVAVAILTVAGATAAQPPEPALDLPPANSMIQRLQRAYQHLLIGNRKDLERNRNAATKFAKEAEGQRQAKGQAAQQRVKTYAEIASLFGRLAEQNSIIVKALEGDRSSDMMAAMVEVPKIEADLEEKLLSVRMTFPERLWLTISEVEQLQASGAKYRTRHPDILPYAKVCWQTDPRARRQPRRQ